MKLIILLLFVTVAAQAMPTGREYERFKALGMLETGNNDYAIGKKAKEVSRYSIKPGVWYEFAGALPLSSAVNPFTAVQIGEALMQPRIAHFVKKHRRQPTDMEWVLLWHCPARVDHPTVDDRDYALRFSNLLL